MAFGFYEFCFGFNRVKTGTRKTAILVSGIEKSHTRPDLVNTLVDRWYLLHFDLKSGPNWGSMR